MAVNVRPVDRAWGGGNQVLQQLVADLEAHRCRVVYRLREPVTAILLMEPRRFETRTFGVSEIARYKRKHPGVRCIHRINECDQRKETSNVDETLRRANVVADTTVFISAWLRDYFMSRWFDASRPHAVITNAADASTFYPAPSPPSPVGPFRVVTHHWSSNWMKGFRTYAEIDRLIAENELEGFELSVIGRWPPELRWRAARTHPPCTGTALAELLRQHHAYVTAALWEPCGMHHIEGAQCGLPLAYHADGGGIVEIGRRYGVAFTEDIAAALLELRDRYGELRQKVLEHGPSSADMCGRYRELLLT